MLVMSRVLVIGDTHCPVMLPQYVPFLKRIAKKHKVNKVVHIGDLVDWSSISYHPKAPTLKNSETEYHKAYIQVQKIYAAFPEVDWLIGNHDALPERHALDAGIPIGILKDYKEQWGLSKWNVHERFESFVIDGVIYQHGDRGRGGQINSAFLNSKDEHMPVVQGHFHSQAGVLYFANKRSRVFGLQVGCGIDYTTAAMKYGMKFNQKPIIGCGVVIGGTHVIFEPMLY